MIETLILYELYKKTLTMYGISKAIKSHLSVLTTPSIGTIKPALVRLELSGFLKTQKTISKGGRPSTFYSVTDPGKTALRSLILRPIKTNPVQFLSEARVKLYCSEILSYDDLKELISNLKLQTGALYKQAEKLTALNEEDFYTRIVLDNISCEYKNFISLLEGIERACKH